LVIRYIITLKSIKVLNILITLQPQHTRMRHCRVPRRFDTSHRRQLPAGRTSVLALAHDTRRRGSIVESSTVDTLSCRPTATTRLNIVLCVDTFESSGLLGETADRASGKIVLAYRDLTFPGDGDGRSGDTSSLCEVGHLGSATRRARSSFGGGDVIASAHATLGVSGTRSERPGRTIGTYTACYRELTGRTCLTSVIDELLTRRTGFRFTRVDTDRTEETCGVALDTDCAAKVTGAGVVRSDRAGYAGASERVGEGSGGTNGTDRSDQLLADRTEGTGGSTDRTDVSGSSTTVTCRTASIAETGVELTLRARSAGGTGGR
jgi:hypothetical protein